MQPTIVSYVEQNVAHVDQFTRHGIPNIAQRMQLRCRELVSQGKAVEDAKAIAIREVHARPKSPPRGKRRAAPVEGMHGLAQLREAIGCNRQTILRYMRADRMTPPANRYWRWPKEEFDRLVADYSARFVAGKAKIFRKREGRVAA